MYIEKLNINENKIEIVKISSLHVTFIIKGNATEQQSYLDNAYREYKNSPLEIDDILNRYGSSMLSTISTIDTQYTKESILPIIKDFLFIKNAHDQMQKYDNVKIIPLIYEKLNDVLYIVYAFDTRENIRYLSQNDLKLLKLDKTQLLKIAKNNLLNYLPEIQTQGDTSELSVVIADGNYEASLLLIDDLWNKNNFPVKGNIVVYIPNRDTVLVTGSDDKINLDKIHEIVYSPNVEWPHIVAEVGFIRSGNTWIEFKREK